MRISINNIDMSYFKGFINLLTNMSIALDINTEQGMFTVVVYECLQLRFSFFEYNGKLNLRLNRTDAKDELVIPADGFENIEIA